MTALLRADGATVRRGRREVLTDVDLHVHDGDVVAVLGPNGAGKSTLLSLLGGLLPAGAGRVERDGRVATALQSGDLAHRRVLANLELALSWWGVPRSQRRARALHALADLRASHLAARPIDALSGGERRRVHLARAVALRADVLLLDEPFSGLDAETRAALLEDTAAALQKGSRAVVLVVHDRAEAWAVANRIVVLLDGRMAADGTPQDLLARPPTADVARFLGYTGEMQIGDQVLLTRPNHVVLDAAGGIAGRVRRRLPQEDAVLVDVEVEGGSLQAASPYPGPVVGDDVRLRLAGGVRYAGNRLMPRLDP